MRDKKGYMPPSGGPIFAQEGETHEDLAIALCKKHGFRYKEGCAKDSLLEHEYFIISDYHGCPLLQYVTVSAKSTSTTKNRAKRYAFMHRLRYEEI